MTNIRITIVVNDIAFSSDQASTLSGVIGFVRHAISTIANGATIRVSLVGEKRYSGSSSPTWASTLYAPYRLNLAASADQAGCATASPRSRPPEGN